MTSNALKVNFSPYLIDIVLKGEVDPSRNKATVSQGTLNITLYKKTLLIWGALEDSNKEISVELRKELAQEQYDRENVLSEARKVKKTEDERFALKQQMALDEQARNRIDELRSTEKKEAEDAVYEAFAKLRHEESNLQPQPNTQLMSIEKEEEEIDIADIDTDDSIITNTVSTPVAPVSLPPPPTRTLPPPRNSAYTTSTLPSSTSSSSSGGGGNKVPIQFTSRIFPTPLRESKVAQEQEWIAKNRKHLKKHAVFSKNIKGKFTYNSTIACHITTLNFFVVRYGAVQQTLM